MKTIFARVTGILFAASVAAFGQAAKPAPAPAPAPTTTATVAPAAPVAEPSAEEPPADRAYNYDPAGRRDPFKSLLVREREKSSRPPGMQGLSVDEIELEGIWKTRSGFLAQAKGSDNRSYLLKRGDLLFDGEVLDVKTNELTLRQNVNDPQSVKPFRDVVKRLNSAKAE
jgi:type IV pilus assembly protein PilP